jgi:hypothetical protein
VVHHGAVPDANEFYEEDEPIERIRGILARPADGVTAPPRTRVTNVQHFQLVDALDQSSKSQAFAVPVRTVPTAAPDRLVVFTYA